MPARFISADGTTCSIPHATMVEASTPGRTVQMLTYGPAGGPIFWGVYRRIVAPGQRGRRTYAPETSLDEHAAAEGAGGGGVGGGARYGEDDVRAFVAREADAVAIWAATTNEDGSRGEGALTVAELFATSMPGRCGMVDLEEGVVPPGQQCVEELLPAEEAARVRRSEVGRESGWAWSRGRVVCVGDAVHKTTPNIGFGCNMAIEGVVVLMNHLRPLLLEAVDADAGIGHVLTASRLDAAFRAYAAARYPRARNWVSISGSYTRGAAYETWSGWLSHRWLGTKILGPRFVARNIFAPLSCDAPVLDWLDEPGFVEGPFPWTYRAGGGGKAAASAGRQEKARNHDKDGRGLGSLAWTWVVEPAQRLVHAIWARFSRQ